MSYQQLTDWNRYKISVLLAQGSSATAIAKAIKIHSSTVYRDLKCKRSRGAYVPGEAHQHASLASALYAQPLPINRIHAPPNHILNLRISTSGGFNGQAIQVH